MRIDVSRRLALVAMVLAATALTAQADVSGMMNYQGRLSDENGVPLDTGIYCLEFRVWNDANNGTSDWTEQLSMVSVIDGSFNVVLGAETPLTGQFSDPARYLGIKVGEKDDPEMDCNPLGAEIKPRQQVLPAPVSIRSGSSERLLGKVETDVVGSSGQLIVKGADDSTRVSVEVSSDAGRIGLHDTSGSETVVLDAASGLTVVSAAVTRVDVEAPSDTGRISLYDAAGMATIVLDAATGVKVPVDNTNYPAGSDTVPEAYWIDLGEGPVACDASLRGSVQVLRVAVSQNYGQDCLCYCGLFTNNTEYRWLCLQP